MHCCPLQDCVQELPGEPGLHDRRRSYSPRDVCGDNRPLCLIDGPPLARGRLPTRHLNTPNNAAHGFSAALRGLPQTGQGVDAMCRYSALITFCSQSFNELIDGCSRDTARASDTHAFNFTVGDHVPQRGSPNPQHVLGLRHR